MRNTSTCRLMVAISLLGIAVCLSTASRAEDASDWQPASPRDEIRPQFSRSADDNLMISHDHREGLDGWYQKSYPIQGGEFYRFQVRRKTSGVSNPRQSCLVRIVWQDDRGQLVMMDAPTPRLNPKLPFPSAEPEYPVDGSTDEQGWTQVSGVYRSPSKAKRAIVELHLQWAPEGRIEWQSPSFEKTDAAPERKVKLATIHYKPSGRSSRENCQEYAPLIAEAGRQHVDLVVLGETIPNAGVKSDIAVTAEKVPGPSTEYFGSLAKDHQLHIVFSLYERDGHLIYNTAVLLGPEGQLIGKYRKVSLPPGEAAKGVAPGKDYPVFDTAIGKVGMMVCYDGFFPEVARELTKNGAEIIAWPVWGCNPKLAEARACENHVYVISSTFMKPEDGWMFSAIYDHGGQPLAVGEKWGTVVAAEVSLGRPYYGPYNLGDFRSMVPRHRPPVPAK